jgi:ankyrin repeat protein
MRAPALFPRLCAIALLLALNGCWLTGSDHDPVLYTPLFAAAAQGDIPAVQTDLAQQPKLVRAHRKDEGWDRETLLHVAVGQNRVDMVRFLLDRGAQVEARTDSGFTALHMAAKNGNSAIITLLLDHHARINAQNTQHRTPLDLARAQGHLDAARLIEERGGKPATPPAARRPAVTALAG